MENLKKNKTINYPVAEQRDINRNIHSRPNGREINAPEAHKTFIRRICGGLVRFWRTEMPCNNCFRLDENNTYKSKIKL